MARKIDPTRLEAINDLRRLEKLAAGLHYTAPNVEAERTLDALLGDARRELAARTEAHFESKHPLS